MSRFINRIFLYSKIFLLLIAFIITFYISLLKMDFYSESVLSSLLIFLPFLLVSIILVFSLFFNKGNNNAFANIVFILVLLAIIIIDYRTLFDKNIVPNFGTEYNFSYFNSQLIKIKVMLYLAILGNLFLLYWENKKNNKIHS